VTAVSRARVVDQRRRPELFSHSQRLSFKVDRQLGLARHWLIHVFMEDTKRIGREGDVAVMMFTEFGRRVEEKGEPQDRA
jgi:hypothetical protein